MPDIGDYEMLKAQVARLEGELAEARAERDVAQETVVALSSVAQERDEAQAANAAKDAVLREHGGFHAPEDCGDKQRPRPHLVGTGKTCFYCEPALSDTGEGCACTSPPMQPCGPKCKYPYTDTTGEGWPSVRDAAKELEAVFPEQPYWFKPCGDAEAEFHFEANVPESTLRRFRAALDALGGK